MAKYGKKAQAKVREVMEEFAAGKLKSGRAGKTVTSRRQAVAIGLAEAREAGAKVPPPGKGKKTSAKKTAAKKKTAGTPKPKAGRKKAKKKSKKKATKKQGAR